MKTFEVLVNHGIDGLPRVTIHDDEAIVTEYLDSMTLPDERTWFNTYDYVYTFYHYEIRDSMPLYEWIEHVENLIDYRDEYEITDFGQVDEEPSLISFGNGLFDIIDNTKQKYKNAKVELLKRRFYNLKLRANSSTARALLNSRTQNKNNHLFCTIGYMFVVDESMVGRVNSAILMARLSMDFFPEVEVLPIKLWKNK